MLDNALLMRRAIRDGVDIANPDTWRMSTEEIRNLTDCAYKLNSIRETLK